MKKELGIEDKLTKLLFNLYFEEKDENEIGIKFVDLVIRKTPKDGVSCKDTIYKLLHGYVSHLVSGLGYTFKNKKFLKEVEKLFSKGNTSNLERDVRGSLAILASQSYGLIEFRDDVYTLSKDIIKVLHRFRYDPRHKIEVRYLPPVPVTETD